MSKKEKGQRIFILTMVGAFVISSLGFSGLVIWDLTKNKKNNTQTEDVQKQLEEQLAKQNTNDKIESTDIKVGDGAEATTGKKVSVQYTGTLQDGKQFDSSVGKEPFSFTLGQGEVIRGWDQGVVGMKVGGKRKLVIPPSLAYGEQSPSPDIPPNSTLVFEIELLNVE